MLAIDDVPDSHAHVLALGRHLVAAYTRHLEGRPRLAIDLLHFHDIVDRLAELRVRATDVVDRVASEIEDRLGPLRFELDNCRQARLRPASLEERIVQISARANQQLMLYRQLFANRSRLTRRPELVTRLYVNLCMARDELHALDLTGLPETTIAEHAGMTDQIDKQLEQLRVEGRAIITMRRRASRDDLIKQLGLDAQAEAKLFDKYTAGARPVDPTVLGALCDRVGELALQMTLLADEDGDGIADAANRDNLEAIARSLIAYEEAYRDLREGLPIVRADAAAVGEPSPDLSSDAIPQALSDAAAERSQAI
jgi:hypothetical protein